MSIGVIFKNLLKHVCAVCCDVDLSATFLKELERILNWNECIDIFLLFTYVISRFDDSYRLWCMRLFPASLTFTAQ